MEEKIIIHNFGGINNLEINLNNINLLTGPQASGKSITAKLIYYFKSFVAEIRYGIENNKSKREIDKTQQTKFTSFFPKESWPNDRFSIDYKSGGTWMKISKEINNPFEFTYSENIKTIIDRARTIFKQEQLLLNENVSQIQIVRNFVRKYNELIKSNISSNSSFNQIFIPAGRSFFSNIQTTIFSFLSTNKSLDPFLIEFGANYENFKRIAWNESLTKNDKEFEDLINGVLNSKYLREKDKDYLLHNDTRKVNLSNASSGQQEILPLLLILKALMLVHFSGEGATLYIEEPEAHLFPDAQKKIVQLLSRLFNSRESSFQIIVTTHSPYILSSYNNLLYAGSIIKRDKNKAKKLIQIVPHKEIIKPSDLSAYSLTKDGKVRKIIDTETGLISQNILDDVSNEASLEFGKLLDLDYGN